MISERIDGLTARESATRYIDPWEVGRCAECGETFTDADERAEVVNTFTQTHELMHAQCYIDHRASDDARREIDPTTGTGYAPCYVLA